MSDIYQTITNTIISALEAGAGEYRRPWAVTGKYSTMPVNANTGKPYHGVNVLTLWATAQKHGYSSGKWATYKQWAELGGQVRKGEKSTQIVFWRFIDRASAESAEAEAEGEESKSRKIPMARAYCVFNADQVDGLASSEAEDPASEEARIQHAEAFFAAAGIDVRPGGDRAYYSPASDTVHMPAFSAFSSPLAYYSVLAHEATHWTGAPSRLNRDLRGRFGSESYAMEELVAELGAAFLCAELGLPTDARADHAPYIAGWLKVLREDKRAIFTAATAATAATNWLRQAAPATLVAGAAC